MGEHVAHQSDWQPRGLGKYLGPGIRMRRGPGLGAGEPGQQVTGLRRTLRVGQSLEARHRKILPGFRPFAAVQQYPRASRSGLANKGIPHCPGIEPATGKGVLCIDGAGIDHVQVPRCEPGLMQRCQEQVVPAGALGDGDPFALEIGDSLDSGPLR